MTAALKAATTHEQDFVAGYVDDLANVIDMDAIRAAGLKIGVDPLGGASLPYWEPIAERYGLNLQVVNKKVDPQFGFMTVDHDGKIRMDCSSPYAMAGLVKLKDDFDVAWGNDPDADRHGIVTPSRGSDESESLSGGGDSVSADASSAVAGERGGRQDAGQQQHDRSGGGEPERTLMEVPVGFKWFAPWPVRRHVLLRRRRERRRQFSAPRWHGVDHR